MRNLGSLSFAFQGQKSNLGKRIRNASSTDEPIISTTNNDDAKKTTATTKARKTKQAFLQPRRKTTNPKKNPQQPQETYDNPETNWASAYRLGIDLRAHKRQTQKKS